MKCILKQPLNKYDGHIMEQSTTLELRNIHKSYGELKVLKGVDLSAKTGQIITIIGASGSGKSTLL